VSSVAPCDLTVSSDNSFETDHEISRIFGPSEFMPISFRSSTPQSDSVSPSSSHDESYLLATYKSPEAPTDISMITPSPPHPPVLSPSLSTAALNEAEEKSTDISKWVGFCLVGDNIDKNVKPRDMCIDHQTQSLHYFNCFALQDRVDLSQFPDSVLRLDPSKLDPKCFMPSKEDYCALEDTMIVLISRVLVQYMTFFREYASVVTKHISHPYSDEMSQKSTVVSTYL